MTAQYFAHMSNAKPSGVSNHPRRPRLVQISVSGLPAHVKRRIQQMAKREHRSSSYVIAEILENAVKEQTRKSPALPGE